MDNHKSPDPIGIAEGYTPAKPYTPPHEEREQVARIQELFTAAEQSRRQYDYNWEFYKLYLQGNQILGRDMVTGETVRVNLRPEDRKRLLSVENLLRRAGRALVGKLTRIIPLCEVIPRTDDQDEIRGAETSTSFLDFIAIKENLRQKYKRAAEGLVWCGTSIFHLQWDSQAGQDIAYCKQCHYTDDKSMVGKPCVHCAMQFEQEAMQKNMERQQMAMELGADTPPPPFEQREAQPMVKINNGDIVIDKLDSREFYPEPGVSDPKLFRYCFVKKAIPVTEARKRWPKYADKISSESGIYTDKSAQYFGNSMRSQVQSLDDHVYWWRYYEAPTTKYEDGRIVDIVNNIMVDEKPNKAFMLLKRMPFFFQWFERNEGELWGEPPIAQAWPTQRERNKLLTQFREWRELSLRPKVLVPENTDLGVDEIDTTPGQILRYNQFGGVPKYMDIPQIPNYAYNELERMESSVLADFGVTPQEIGQTKGDPSGRFAAILEAQSSESISPILVENSGEWQDLGRCTLIFGQHYYSRDRAWTVYGKDRIRSNTWGTMVFEPPQDVRIIEVDSLSKNPAIRQEQMRAFLQDGAFNNPQTGLPDMRLYLRATGIYLPGASPDVMSREHAYFAQVPEMIAQGVPFEPKPWDDARTAVEELVEWLRGKGRSANPDLQMQVGQLYLYYLSLLAPAPTDGAIMGTPGIPPPQGQPTGLGAGAMPGQPSNQPVQQGDVAQNAGDIIQAADQTGEAAVRGNTPHEG